MLRKLFCEWFVDDISYCSPDGEIIIWGYLYFWIFRVGRNEPSFVSTFDEAFQGIFTVEFANCHLTL